MVTVFDQLEACWARDDCPECESTLVAPARWQDDGALVGLSPAALVSQARGRCGSEPALAALVRRARGDHLAAHTATMILLPAAKALLCRVRGLPGRPQERALTVIEAIWEIIRCYPAHRPGTVAGNVSAELFSRLLTERDGPVRTRIPGETRRPRRTVSVTVDLDAVAVELPDPAPLSGGAELVALLAQAVADGRLELTAATLIGRYRICDISTEQLAAELGVQAQSVRRNRQRAEQRLIAAAA